MTKGAGGSDQEKTASDGSACIVCWNSSLCTHRYSLPVNFCLVPLFGQLAHSFKPFSTFQPLLNSTF